MADIRSPIPGTFYRRPSPDAAPYKEVGDSVAVDDVIGLVEVMKSFIEVKADAAGTLKAFKVENEEPIMAGAVIAELDD